jgi:preprotein translocase subunit YajC
MESSTGSFKVDDVLFLALTAAVAAGAALVVFIACFYWFRREQRRLQKKILQAIAKSDRISDEIFLTGGDAATCGELVAQFKVNHGKQVVSVLESDGIRFIHVDGELSGPERARMMRYLKSEGFMS